MNLSDSIKVAHLGIFNKFIVMFEFFCLIVGQQQLRSAKLDTWSSLRKKSFERGHVEGADEKVERIR